MTINKQWYSNDHQKKQLRNQMIKQGNATLAGETEARLFQVKDHPNCSSIIALNSLDLEIIRQNIFKGVKK